MEGSPLQTGRGSCRSRKPGKGTPGSDPHLPGHRARLNSQPGSPGTHVLETAPDWAHSLGHLRLTNMFSCCVPVFRACRLRRASGRDASRPWRQWVRSCTGRLRSLARRDPKVTQGDPETSSPPRHRSDLTCAAPGPLPSVCVCVCVCVCLCGRRGRVWRAHPSRCRLMKGSDAWWAGQAHTRSRLVGRDRECWGGPLVPVVHPEPCRWMSLCPRRRSMHTQVCAQSGSHRWRGWKDTEDGRPGL